MPLVGDHSGSRRFAFVLISSPAASPGFVLRRALEEVGGNPHFGLAASHYGAMMILFPSQEVRETTMALFPVSFLGHTISLERPEFAENRFGWRYAGYAQISASGFPLEYWTEGRIRNAFHPISNVAASTLCASTSSTTRRFALFSMLRMRWTSLPSFFSAISRVKLQLRSQFMSFAIGPMMLMVNTSLEAGATLLEAQAALPQHLEVVLVVARTCIPPPGIAPRLGGMVVWTTSIAAAWGPWDRALVLP
jgi:hypothetical protein